jgi:hypothetical protein
MYNDNLIYISFLAKINQGVNNVYILYIKKLTEM